MADIPLTQGERYTFAKVNTVPVIISSTDGAEDTNYFRNNVQITGSLRQDGDIILDGQLQIDNESIPIELENASNVAIRFRSTDTGIAGSQRYVIGIDSNHPTYGNNTFAIKQSSGLSGDAGLRISGSTVILDYDELATSATGLPKGAIYRDASNFLKIVP